MKGNTTLKQGKRLPFILLSLSLLFLFSCDNPVIQAAVISHSVIFDANNGSGTMAPQSIPEGQTAALTLNVFTRSGHVFTGWNTMANGSGTPHADTANIAMGTADITLYAQWVAAYAVIFDPNGGSGTMPDQMLVTGATANLTANAFTRLGHSFKNWNTVADGSGTAYSNGTALTMGTENITLFAQWTIKTYLLTFNPNGAVGSNKSQVFAFNSTANLDPNTFSLSGYTFLGWASSQRGPVILADGASYTMYTEGQTLFAKWRGAPGQPDIHYGTGGIKGNSTFNSTAIVVDFAVQPDGKILTAINSGTYPISLVVARWNDDGTLDNSFGNNGKVVTAIGEGAFPCSIALLPDDKILLAGTIRNPSYNTGFVIVRYNSDGSLDTGFGSGGIATTVIGESTTAQDMAVLPDGKIVLAGYTYLSSKYRFALAMYNSDGTQNTGFDNDGFVTSSFGTANSSMAYSVAIQSDNKIVAAGCSGSDGASQFTTARYNQDGTLDGSFNGTGFVRTTVDVAPSLIRSVIVQPDGRILAGGTAGTLIGNDFALVRYNPDGSLDASFEGDGKAITNFAITFPYCIDEAYALVLQSDAKILLAGTSQADINDINHYEFAVARYNPDGSPDVTFDDDGRATMATTGNVRNNDICRALVILPDGTLLAGGKSSALSCIVFIRYWL